MDAILSRAGIPGSSGASASLSPVAQGLHTVWSCRVGTRTIAVKELQLRPSIAGWRERFERAGVVEREVASRGDFLPRSIVTDSGSVVFDVEGRWFLLHEWVDGIPVSHLNSAEDWTSLASIMATTATVPVDMLPSMPAAGDDPPAAIGDVIEALPNRSESAEVHRILATCNDRVEALLADERAGDSVIGHRDLTVQNLLRRRDGRLVILDWENAGRSSLESELGRLCASIPPATAIDNIAYAVGALPAAARGRLLLKDSAWLGDWVRGHLMFMRYWALSRPDRTERLVLHAQQLRQAIDNAPRLLAAAAEAI
jgi:hypothetical protein